MKVKRPSQLNQTVWLKLISWLIIILIIGLHLWFVLTPLLENLNKY